MRRTAPCPQGISKSASHLPLIARKVVLRANGLIARGEIDSGFGKLVFTLR